MRHGSRLLVVQAFVVLKAIVVRLGVKKEFRATLKQRKTEKEGTVNKFETAGRRRHRGKKGR